MKLNDKGRQRVEEFRQIEGIRDYFNCPECKAIGIEVELKLHSNSFCFRCPNCYFDLGGGTFYEDEILTDIKQSVETGEKRG